MFKFKDLFDVLMSEGVLSEDNLTQLSRFVERWNVSQYSSVVETNLLTESRLLDLLSKSLSLKKMCSLSEATVCLQCIKDFPQPETEKNGFLILAESTTVRTFVCADPFVISDYFSKFKAVNPADGPSGTTGLVLSTRSEVQKKIRSSYGSYRLANFVEKQFDPDSVFKKQP